MKDLSAIVLAAGEGTRLRPLTKYRPKPMLPAVTRPILGHVLDELIDAGITEITVVVGHRRTRIQSHFGPTYRDIELSFQTQEKQLGTGHALLAADPPDDEPVLVVYGDQIVDRTLITDVLSAHGDGPATLGVLPGMDVSEYGGAIVRGGEVEELVDRPTDDREYFLNAGVYVFEPAVHEAVAGVEAREGEQSLIDGIVRLVDRDDPVTAAVSDGFWVDATYPWDLLDIAEQLLNRGYEARRSAKRGTPTIHERAVVREPVAIAADCEIGPNAVVGPFAALGENVTVSANAVVEHSVLDADTRVGPNATVIDTVTGVGARIGAGSTIPGGPGDVRVDERIFEAEALGALLADRVIDAGGVTYLPGTVVGPDSKIGAGAVVRGSLAEATTIGS